MTQTIRLLCVLGLGHPELSVGKYLHPMYWKTISIVLCSTHIPIPVCQRYVFYVLWIQNTLISQVGFSNALRKDSS